MAINYINISSISEQTFFDNLGYMYPTHPEDVAWGLHAVSHTVAFIPIVSMPVGVARITLFALLIIVYTPFANANKPCDKYVYEQQFYKLCFSQILIGVMEVLNIKLAAYTYVHAMRYLKSCDFKIPIYLPSLSFKRVN